MKRVIYVAGARPNFVKISNILRESKNNNLPFLFVHTGQHYTKNMSGIFLEELKINKPDINLEVGSGSHAQQTANIMKAFEPVILNYKPDVVVVVGDINSTIACALVSSKLNVLVAHVEAGLRSFDRSMPEEINRILTDSISDFLFVSEQSGISNLKKEGADESKIHFVGNVMIDTLVYNRNKIRESNIIDKIGLVKNDYITATFHRSSNVDDFESLKKIIKVLEDISLNEKIVLPLHPRTMANIEKNNLKEKILKLSNLKLIDPLGYIDFIKLISKSKMVITDSGGIQEETTFLGVPCFTLRKNTERPITIQQGTNHLVIADSNVILEKYNNFKKHKKFIIPKLWDENTAKRIIRILIERI